MNNKNIWLVFLVLGMIGLVLLSPDFAFANFGGFESRVNGLTGSIIKVVLPALAILGLIYASILAVTGDGSAKGRIVMVITCSVIGFLAPLIIKWLQSVSGY